ncbi:MAG: hypothetical protein KJO29_01405 [Bacteroidia bacterium]|nr:hypothetical protein [Bacteroidia bacterium]
MNYKLGGLAGIILLMSIAMSCNRGPKVIAPGNANVNGVSQSGIFSDDKLKNEASEVSDEVHTVVVQEVLPTSKYVYARVTEGEEEYWVATTKKEVELGATYYFRDGLLKLNFESQEFDRVFDKVYLVSSLVSSTHGQEVEKSSAEAEPGSYQKEDSSGSPEIALKEGSVSIAELLGNKDKYEGKSVQLTGKCVKINANIMGRNWIHLKDGSMDSYDLVVTSDKIIPEGQVVTMKGMVVLNKDFGAGYKYEILVEDGELVKD